MKPVIPIQLPEEQAQAISEAARETGMSQQDVIRQTLKLFLPDFVERMSPISKPRRGQSVWDALHFGRGIDVEFKPMPGTVKKVNL
ncbi:MAG: ribbon-helix-helix domain-containing protein [Limisphaerales bacterium]